MFRWSVLAKSKSLQCVGRIALSNFRWYGLYLPGKMLLQTCRWLLWQQLSNSAEQRQKVRNLIDKNNIYISLFFFSCDPSDPRSCKKSLEIFFDNTHVTVEKDNLGKIHVFSASQSIVVPSTYHGMVFENLAHYIRVKGGEKDFTLKWDGFDAIFIEVG